MKPIVFLGHSLATLRDFPPEVRRRVGYDLDKVQRGDRPRDAKAMFGLGIGVQELRISSGGAWRVVYVASRAGAVFVLHAFEKKSQATSSIDVAAIRAAYRELT